jgi:hypothetical protein
MGAEESLERLLSAEFGEEAASKRLLLNRLHPVVSQMIDGAADAGLLRAWLRMIYHIALLEAREVPIAAETRRFSRSFGNVFAAATLGPL